MKVQLLFITLIVVAGLANAAGAAEVAAYPDTLQAIAARRSALADQYRAATTDSARAAVIARAQQEFARDAADTVIPFWLGTRWDFNGTTQVPGTGMIACGYFVTTVLRDVGFAVERVKLAQQASETIILSLVGSDEVSRFSDATLSDFVEAVRRCGHGLYVVGLDYHVGFLHCDERGVRFLHASYLEPACVVVEDAGESRVLGSSRYRVIGKLTDEPALAVRWLTGAAIPTIAR